MAALFESLKLGSLELPNRILMAPLTRARAGREGVPNELMAAYYAQRAGAGLIISEATGISREGLGWPALPGFGTRRRSRDGRRSPTQSTAIRAESSPSCGIWAGSCIRW